jgi:2-polyprenyl-3-methyl-5-hydroxy-6-metoxy-1,4-benzoquinol methylase
MIELSGNELVARYKANYGIAGDAYLDEAMVRSHWDLERCLRNRLLTSTPENRWDTFERAYTTLYHDLHWLNDLGRSGFQDTPKARFAVWAQLIGAPPKRVYEVGSGRGEMIEYLAQLGFECKATEITKERGRHWTSAHPNLQWGVSDGVHLDQFELAGHYDAVISNQVIEHVHPDDIVDHLIGVRKILAPGGTYILSTPHALAGPSDVSRVFGEETPLGMHLKEYTYRELDCLLNEAGFAQVLSPVRLPTGIRDLLGERVPTVSSRPYLAYLELVERLIAALPRQSWRREAAKMMKLLLFTPNIFVMAHTAN